MRGHNLGSGRRCWRAHVGDKIGDCEISFVADGGDDRNRGAANRARNYLFIKSPEVFDGSAAASDNDYVYPVIRTRTRMKVVEELDRAHDLLGRAITLHAR